MSRTDTTPEADAVQRAVWERLGPEGRVALAFEMSEQMRCVSLDGLRARHPDASDDELVLLLIDLWHGPDVAREVAKRRGR